MDQQDAWELFVDQDSCASLIKGIINDEGIVGGGVCEETIGEMSNISARDDSWTNGLHGILCCVDNFKAPHT